MWSEKIAFCSNAAKLNFFYFRCLTLSGRIDCVVFFFSHFLPCCITYGHDILQAEKAQHQKQYKNNLKTFSALDNDFTLFRGLWPSRNIVLTIRILWSYWSSNHKGFDMCNLNSSQNKITFLYYFIANYANLFR